MEELIIKIISNIGIPAGIALFVLVRLEKAIKDLDKTIDRNTTVLTAVLVRLGYGNEVNKMLKMTTENGRGRTDLVDSD